VTRPRPNLRESFWDLLESSPFPFLGFYTDRSLFFYNQAAQHVFGYPSAEVEHLEAWIQRVSHEREPRIQFSRLWIQCFSGDAPAPVDLQVQTSEGKRKLRFGLVPLRAEGVVLGALAWVSDAAKRRRDSLAQKSFDQQRTNLLAMVSHEFRAPLVSIRGYNELILRERLGPITEQQRRGLEIALRNVGHLAELIDNLLMRSRLELGVSLHRNTRVDIVELVREVLASFQPQLDEKHLRLSTQLEPNPLWCLGDRQSLYRVFTNLLANAVKFTAEQGSVEVGVSALSGEIHFSVRDSGVGIPAAELARIFEPFYQAESAVTRRFRGAGLGLALVKDIVSQHRGRIEVESAPGTGSCFTVSLPAAGGNP
jgi:signal transduction histidine kinase